jgi:hypothetical protein
VHRYLALTAANTRWDQLPGNTAFPARKNVLLSTTACGARRSSGSDPQLIALAAEHGFRPTDPRPFAETLRKRGLPEPPPLVDVVEPPSYDTLALSPASGCTSPG